MSYRATGEEPVHSRALARPQIITKTKLRKKEKTTSLEGNYCLFSLFLFVVGFFRSARKFMLFLSIFPDLSSLPASSNPPSAPYRGAVRHRHTHPWRTRSRRRRWRRCSRSGADVLRTIGSAVPASSVSRFNRSRAIPVGRSSLMEF